MPNTAENRSHERSGCRYSQRSFRYVVYPKWPSGHPDAPALETQDTFDGTGQVVKHVNHVRHDDSYDLTGYGLTYAMSDTTTTTYYVHSTVLGGKTIAELDQYGVKTGGYVYAGGARVATQTVYGSSNAVQIESTNPVTGAAIITDANGSSATRQEPDPLGRDLTQAPDPTVVVDPISNSKFNEAMPIEYAPNWTGEMEIGMAQYVDTMDMTVAREAYKRWLKERKANPDLNNSTNTNYNIWQNILNKNPNVGIVKGQERLWGADAATFLEKNANSISLGHAQNQQSSALGYVNIQTMVIEWEVDITHGSPVGHVSYIEWQKNLSLSWDMEGGPIYDQDWTRNKPSSDYTNARSRQSAGMGYLLDFSNSELNAKFQSALENAYNSFGNAKYPYDPFICNCGEAFNVAINAIHKEIGVPTSHKVTPGDIGRYIEKFLMPKGYVIGQQRFPRH